MATRMSQSGGIEKETACTKNSTAGGEQIKPRIFTTKRRGKTFLFIDIAKFNPKKFGAFGSKQWFMSLVKHLDEPGVVRLENVKSWFQQFYDTFANAQYGDEEGVDSPSSASSSPSSSSSGDQDDNDRTPSTESHSEEDSDVDIETRSSSSPQLEILETPKKNSPVSENSDQKEPPSKLASDDTPPVSENGDQEEPVPERASDDTPGFGISNIEDEAVYEFLAPFRNDANEAQQNSGINLDLLDPGLIDEVLCELDTYFLGIDTDEILKMVAETPAPK
ncbi:uncharacterized protein LOC118438151 [Folsomia candida]|uniref:Uncharacterized protein n=1 Tax=Folsomia candida TaxID=158441 RepID=A0A226DHC0_FOLCA|nr:uncharacterized protein LOC118438151 [Folsomia candida]OXA44530.1 hypothetical protein Fcan01_20450 [Folsomia candida]